MALLTVAAPASPKEARAIPRSETATLAGGCFWSMNAIFERVKGVDRVVAGFSGGTARKPSYEEVCTGTTGHAESVQITFDPAVISYRDLLHVFFAFHDPTTPNRQGADEGEQYRSAIFWQSPAQKATAEQVIAELTKNRNFNAPIVTQLVPYSAFYPAEDYHQAYYDKNADRPYCRAVIAPKVAKLRKLYAGKLKGTS
jgi:peptide-methionine (S)-S-oxide reductase